MAGLTAEQYKLLTNPLATARVSHNPQGQSHLEAWDVRRHLIRFFGFGGWDFTVVACDLVKEIEHPERRRKNKQGEEYGDPFTPWTVVYRVIGRLTVRTADGQTLCQYEDGATGDAVNQPSLGDAHDMALKTAMSQALKRCAVNLGDQFGLSLYDDGSTAATVLLSLVVPAGVKETKGDSTGDSDRGRSEPGTAGPGAGPDSQGVGERRPGRDGAPRSLRPGVQPGVHRGAGSGGPPQASGDRRDTPAAVGG